MAAPKVQSISELMTELAPGYDEQAQVIGQQQEAIGQQFDAQRQGLEAQKDRQFNVINDQATGRGASFSGIPIHEQADYLSTHYLPGVQASYAQENQQRLSLSEQLARLRTEQRNMAFGTRQTQLGWVNDWNMNERGIQATAEQNQLNRDFEARMAQENRAFQASQSALDRSHQAGMAAASAPRTPDLGAVSSFLQSKVGGSGAHRGVSPADYQRGRELWMQQGGDPGSYDVAMAGYRPRTAGASYGLSV